MSSKGTPPLSAELKRAKRLHRLANACLVVIFYAAVGFIFSGIVSLASLEKPGPTNSGTSTIPASFGPPLGIACGVCLLLVVASIFVTRGARRRANAVISEDDLKARIVGQSGKSAKS
jgi:hypothetical protein